MTSEEHFIGVFLSQASAPGIRPADAASLLRLLAKCNHEVLRLYPVGGTRGDHPKARKLRDLARTYEPFTGPRLTRRLLEIADALDGVQP